MSEVDLLGRSMSPRLLVSGYSEVRYGERPRAWTSGDLKRAGSIWEGHPGRQKERFVVWCLDFVQVTWDQPSVCKV